jgi:hypothetical protein
MFRKDRRKGLPLFASILHVSNAGLFLKMVRPLARHLLIHHGALATLVELESSPAIPSFVVGIGPSEDV